MHDAGKFLRTLSAILVALIALLAAGPTAWAKGNKTVVIHGEGPESETFAKEVAAAVPKGIDVADAKGFNAALAKQGHKGAMGKALDGSKTRDKLFERVRKAAEASKVDAVVIIRVVKEKKGRKVQIYVVDPQSTALAREDEIALPAKKGKDDSKQVVASIVPALEKFKPDDKKPDDKKPDDKKPDDKKPDDKKPDDDKKDDDKKDDDKKDDDKKDDKKPEDKAARPTGEVPRALLIFGAGIDLGMRRLEYNQPITRNLRAYSVTGAPMLALSLEAYPLAGMGGPIGDIGITGHYGRAFALQSAPAGGEKINTNWERLYFGLRYRLRFGSDKPAMLGINVGYGAESFTFASSGTISEESPETSYRFIKAALDGRIPLGSSAAIVAGAGWLFVMKAGKVADRFPQSKVGGIEGFLGAAFTITKGLEARLQLRYTRFFYSMNPNVGDKYVAGGALDQFASLHLGAAYVY